MKRILLLFFIFCANHYTGLSQEPYLQLTEICTDHANIMSSTQRKDLGEKLYAFEAETRHQIVVLTIPTLGRESIEKYALKVFEQNEIGQLDLDNGVLILFAAENREVRIEVGYGLESIITDAISSRIIRNVMIPEFKANRYYEGIDLAADEIIQVIKNPIYADEFANQREDVQIMPMWGRILIVLFVGGFLSVFFIIGFHFLKKSYKDLVNGYRGLISGDIGLLYFPFLMFGVFFGFIFGIAFTFVPLFFFLFFLAIVIFNLNMDGLVDTIFDSVYFSGGSVMGLMGFLLVALPIFLASLIVKRYGEGFALSIWKSNDGFIKKNLSFFKSSSSSRSSRSSKSSSKSSSFSRSSSRSSFSGGGGRSGGGGASGRW